MELRETSFSSSPKGDGIDDEADEKEEGGVLDTLVEASPKVAQKRQKSNVITGLMFVLCAFQRSNTIRCDG